MKNVFHFPLHQYYLVFFPSNRYQVEDLPLVNELSRKNIVDLVVFR